MGDTMTAKHILGVLLISSPFIVTCYYAIKDVGFLLFLKYIGTVIFIILMVTSGGFLLSGCTTTRTIEVPVAIPCTKPKNIPVPHDYIADLDNKPSAQRFVPACLATIEDYKNSYNACMLYHQN